MNRLAGIEAAAEALPPEQKEELLRFLAAQCLSKPLGAEPNTPVGRILVVDDEPDLRSILVESLLSCGYEVTGCGSGRYALAELRERVFDLLLTDLLMPEMDGVALLKAALEIDPHLIGIILTGQGTIQTAFDAMQLGAFDYVIKPFRLQNLLPVLTRALNTRELRRENLRLRQENFRLRQENLLLLEENLRLREPLPRQARLVRQGDDALLEAPPGAPPMTPENVKRTLENWP